MKVEILLPKRWKSKVRYKLLEDVLVNNTTIPKGFISDGASVPRLLWWLFPPVDRYLKAAFLHDYLLKTGHPWKVANDEFNTALKTSKIRKWRRLLIISSVVTYSKVKELFSV